MTDSQEQLVQDTFVHLEPRAEEFERLYYQRLFATTPAVASFFDPDAAAQNRAWLGRLRHVEHDFRHFDAAELLVATLVEMGGWHHGLPLRAWHYDNMGEAMIWALRQILRAEFSEETESAWRLAYQEAVRALTSGENNRVAEAA
jgi:hemoglobin-like flavoprotein